MIDKKLFTDINVYDHKSVTDKELLLSDNSITMHRRKKPGPPNRLAYRIKYDPSKPLDSPWHP